LSTSRVALLLNGGLSVGVCVALNACQPKDTRPPPSRVLVTATADEAVLSGIPNTSSEDGWDIVYDRLLLSLGRVELGGSGCNTYSTARYIRLLDMQRPGSQKVSESYALGQCDFGFGISELASDSPLGANVSAQDLTFMRTVGTDRFVDSDAITAYVEGRAVKQDISKHFSWAFRGRFSFSACTSEALTKGLTLAKNGSLTVDLQIRGEALFEDQLDAIAPTLRFDPFADADTKFGDNDGQIMLDELAQVPLSVLSALGYAAVDRGTGPWQTLGDYVYFGVLPSMVRFGDTGSCTVRFGDDPGMNRF
jgi:hypothetical protein